jgi:hypothetical protein
MIDDQPQAGVAAELSWNPDADPYLATTRAQTVRSGRVGRFPTGAGTGSTDDGVSSAGPRC